MKKVYAKIEEAKTKIGLSSRALSVRIGHHASYLSQIRVLSTEKQERLLRELNAAIDGEKVKSDTQIILGLVDELKDSQSDAINLKGEIQALHVVISDLEAYKKQAAFDLTEAHSSIDFLKKRLEFRRTENRNLVKELDDRKETQKNLAEEISRLEAALRQQAILLEDTQENFAAANINSQLIENKLASKMQILDDYYHDLDDLEKTLDEVCNQRDQLLDANKSLEDYYDVLACKNNRFGVYIFLLIVTLSITLIAFLIYVQSH